MRKFCSLFFIVFQGFAIPAITQLPVYWTRNFGGTNNDNRALMELTPDKGFIVAGNCRSSDGNINLPLHGGSDVVLMKLDSCGNVQWKKNYGGSGEDLAYSLKLTPDGGYIFGGMTDSHDGDVSGLHGNAFDWWLVKVNSSGNIQWQKTIGGTLTDVGVDLAFHPNGSIIVVGHTGSTDGDLTGVPSPGLGSGLTDAWIACLSNTGNIIWQKKLGSFAEDVIGKVIVAPDGTIVACGATPADADLPMPAQPINAWVFKMDITGNIIWSKTFGGTKNDYAYTLFANAAGELFVAGASASSDGDLTTNNGMDDAWVFKLSPNGDLIWQLSMGGNDYERSWDIIPLPDQTILLCGETRSTDGSFVPQYGLGDAFFADISSSGQLIWKKNYGGSLPDLLFSVRPLPGNNLVACGISGSSDHDLDDNYGIADIWLAKFKNKPFTDLDTTVCNKTAINNIVINNDTLVTVTVPDQCGYSSAYKRYNVHVVKVDVHTIGDAIIQPGQSVTLSTTAIGTIAWQPQSSLSCLNCNDPVATPAVTTEYIVNAQSGSCVAADTVKIIVAGKDEIYIPSAFSPNDDGINDVFMATGSVENFHMQVFNRWGDLVFSTHNISAGWNGSLKGKQQPAGNYVYIVTYTNASGKQKLLKGNLLLTK